MEMCIHSSDMFSDNHHIEEERTDRFTDRDLMYLNVTIT